MVEGLARGRVAFVAKVYYRADGGAIAQALIRLAMGECADQRHASPGARRTHQHARQATLARLAGRRLSRQLHFLQRRLKGAEQRPRNRVLEFDTANLPRADLERIAASLGAGLNDVLLAVAAGALRACSIRRGEVPDWPVVTSLPTYTASHSPSSTCPTPPQGCYTVLRTDIKDPIRRFLSTKEITDAARAGTAQSNRSQRDRSTRLERGWPSCRAADHDEPAMSFAIDERELASHLDAPRSPGIESYCSMGALQDNVSVGMTATLDGDVIRVAILASPEFAVGASELASALHTALSDLIRARAAQSARRPRSRFTHSPSSRPALL